MTHRRTVVGARRCAVGLLAALVGCGGGEAPRSLLGDAGPGGALLDAGGDGQTSEAGGPLADGSLPAEGGSDAAADGGPKVVKCGEVTRQPELGKPVDIVWVIDNSGSMGDEAASVATNLVGFADQLQTSQLDYHLVVISRRDFVPEYAQLEATLPADRFLFVNESVGSQEPLEALVDTFPQYQPVLRDAAVTHFVAVTDDEARSQCTADFFTCLLESAADRAAGAQARFDTDISALLGGEDYIFHAIASPDPECAGAANPGLSYYGLAAATGGRTFEVCSPDWSSLFDELGTAIDESVEVSCSIPIPEPPEGFALNPTQVRLDFTLGDDTSLLSRVASEADCGSGGWYFDRPLLPQLIELCPDTCGLLTSDATAKLDVTLECGANACEGARSDAAIFSTPVDVVIAVDGSAAMADELPKLEAELPGLASALDAAGLDHRIVVVRPAYAGLSVPAGGAFVEVDMALSGGNLLVTTLAEFASVSAHLRATAVTHFVFVTNDEATLLDGSVPTPIDQVQATVDGFVTSLTAGAALGHDFVAHAIASEDPACSGTAGAAVAPGRVYYGLASDTGGSSHSVCNDNWGAAFEQIATAVSVSVPVDCAYALPEPPDGQSFAADEVNVRFGYAGAARAIILGQTSGVGECDAGGWYYDNPADPGMVQLCPVTCDEVQGKPGAAIDIELGCETEVLTLD